MTKMNHEHLNKMDKLKTPRKKSRAKAAGLGPAWSTFKAKYANTCGLCAGSISIGEKVSWNKHTKEIYHHICLMKMINGKKEMPEPPPKPKPGPFKGRYQIPLHKREDHMVITTKELEKIPDRDKLNKPEPEKKV